MALFSTSYFGSILYYSSILRSEDLTIEQHESYVKQSYRNRCSILSANGAIDLIVPVQKVSGVKSVIKDVRIDYSTRWQKIHERSIVSAYKNSPYFDHYFDSIEPLFNAQPTFLLDMNMDILEKMVKMLEIDIPISLSDDFISPGAGDNDFRYSITPKDRVGIEALKPYYQVFSDKMDFVPDLSILDLLFCEGRSAREFL